MPIIKTTRRSICFVCCAVAMLAAGCGGSHESRAQACSSTLQALQGYRAAVLKVGQTGVRPSNRLNLEAASAAAGKLRTRVQALAKLESGTSADQLNSFANALQQQQLVVTAIVANDVKAVAEHAKGLNQGIAVGLISLPKLCAHP